MRVAIVDSWFHWPPVGGAIRSVKEIADRLSKKGVDVTILAPAYATRDVGDIGFTIRGLEFRKMTGPSFYRAIRRALREISPDVVFVTSGNLLKPYMIYAASGYPTLVRLYAYELRCPSSYGILFRDGHICSYSFLRQPHKCATCTEDIRRVYYKTSQVDRPETIMSLKFVYPFYHALVKRALGKISLAVATSAYMRSQFEGVIPRERIKVIPEGVDTAFFSPREKSKRDFKIITLPGRTFDPLKGLDVLLRACAHLWQERQDFRVVVTGSNRADIKDYPFMGGNVWLDDKDIPAMYSNSDIVVVPSIWGEPFGLTALEAMSCEVPVVASRIGGLQEIVRDGETGLLFTAGDYLDLSTKLAQLLDDGKTRVRMGRQGRSTAIEKYSWDGIIDSYFSILNQLKESAGKTN